jgi:poly(A) polymerase
MNVTQKPQLHQDWIDPHAIGIVRALQKKGFTTYLVGGCVRDLLIGIHPKDYDIATNASPEEVKDTIHRSYIIGRRFQLVLVRREDQQFEVATFRREVPEGERTEDMPAGDNAFGTPEEDARRRDFTINGLFYDPIAEQLIDFAEGLPDLEQRWVRMIGEPRKRLLEDPIRIMRALRLKHMIGFQLEPSLRQAMCETCDALTGTALPRRREEILKWLKLKNPDLAFREAHDMGILKHLSPTLDARLTTEPEAAEVFYARLRQLTAMAEMSPAPFEPGDWFGMLMHAFVRSFVFVDLAGTSPSANRIMEDEELQKWMRDELGMFKLEQTVAVKALHVESLLARRGEFEKRGERRQRAVIANESFPMALKFAECDYLLSPSDLLFWRQAAGRLAAEGGGFTKSDRRPRRRRRPRSRKPKTGNTEARN